MKRDLKLNDKNNEKGKPKLNPNTNIEVIKAFLEYYRGLGKETTTRNVRASNVYSDRWRINVYGITDGYRYIEYSGFFTYNDTLVNITERT